MKRVLGAAMLVLLFVGIFVVGALQGGWKNAALSFLIAGGVIAWVTVSVMLLDSHG